MIHNATFISKTLNLLSVGKHVGSGMFNTGSILTMFTKIEQYSVAVNPLALIPIEIRVFLTGSGKCSSCVVLLSSTIIPSTAM